jgi:D-alanyl-D-alanine carboxypeptidase
MRKTILAAILTLPVSLFAFTANAGPALLFDPADGRVLYAEELDDQWHPASLTKIMTAYVTFKAIRDGKIKLKQKITYSKNARAQPPSKLGLAIGSRLSVEQALKALIVKSANDVAVMIAEAVAGDGNALTFVARMNETARELGMTRTTFVNPNGLPASAQVTTARDLAKLARAVIKEFPEHSDYWSMSEARVGRIRLRSHNGLLRTFDGADGIKTGFICDSGFNVVASATRDGRKLVAVVLGEYSGGKRTLRAASLLEHGFQQYGWKSLFRAPNIDTTPIAADAKSTVSIRKKVVSWACGNRKRKKNVASKKARRKAALARRKAALARKKAKKTAAAKKAKKKN